MKTLFPRNKNTQTKNTSIFGCRIAEQWTNICVYTLCTHCLEKKKNRCRRSDTRFCYLIQSIIVLLINRFSLSTDSQCNVLRTLQMNVAFVFANKWFPLQITIVLLHIAMHFHCSTGGLWFYWYSSSQPIHTWTSKIEYEELLR